MASINGRRASICFSMECEVEAARRQNKNMEKIVLGRLQSRLKTQAHHERDRDVKEMTQPLTLPTGLPPTQFPPLTGVRPLLPFLFSSNPANTSPHPFTPPKSCVRTTLSNSCTSSPSTTCVANPTAFIHSPPNLAPVNAQYNGTSPGARNKKPIDPASGRRAIRHSGIAKVEVGVTTRKPAPWNMPAPPPMTMPSQMARTGLSVESLWRRESSWYSMVMYSRGLQPFVGGGSGRRGEGGRAGEE